MCLAHALLGIATCCGRRLSGRVCPGFWAALLQKVIAASTSGWPWALTRWLRNCFLVMPGW